MQKILKPQNDDCPPELLQEMALALAGPNGTTQLTPEGWVYENPDSKNIADPEGIGFPAGQLVGNGMEIQLARKVSHAFWTGQDIKAMAGELTPTLERIIERLEDHSQRGKEMCWVYENSDFENIADPEEVGFPDGQLVGNGMEIQLAQKVSHAFWTGQDMKAAAGELTPRLERIIERLEGHSQRGKGM